MRKLAIIDIGSNSVRIDIHEIKDVLCIGTAALRRASNGAEFVQKVFDLYKIKIDIISGEMETFYDYCAVINSFDLEEGLLVDIGGNNSCTYKIINHNIT